MKRIKTLLILLCLTMIFNIPARTQVSGYKPFVLKLGIPVKEDRKYTLPYFSHFQVMDERPDTARIGLHANSRKASHLTSRQWVFPQPFSREVEGYLNGGFTNPGGDCSALVVFRTLWISDTEFAQKGIRNDPGNTRYRMKIRLKAEVYVGRDSQYRPLLRFDYTLDGPNRSFEDLNQELAGMLAGLADSAAFLAAHKMEKPKRLSLDDIRRFNQSRFQAPICVDSSLARGVYASFHEFKENAPSIRDFEIHSEKKQQFLYLKDAEGHVYFSRTVWGYCDGKTVFIMKDGSLHETWKEGQSFCLIGNVDEKIDSELAGVTPGNVSPDTSGQARQHITVPGKSYGGVPVAAGILAGGLVGGAIVSSINTDPKFHQRLFILDMDSGTLY